MKRVRIEETEGVEEVNFDESSSDSEQIVKRACYCELSGAPFPKEIFTRNLDEAHKSNKFIDLQAIIDDCNHPDVKDTPMERMGHRMVHFGYLINKLLGAESSELLMPRNLLEESNSKTPFSIQKAVEVDRETILPGGKPVTITKLINVSMAANWAGKPTEKAFDAAVRDILNAIRSRDDYFHLYCASKSSRVVYARVSDDFFERLAVVLHAGFGMKMDDDALQKSVVVVKTIFNSSVDKLRGRRTASLTEQMKNFRQLLTEHPNFRYNEVPIEDCDPHVPKKEEPPQEAITEVKPEII